MFGWFDFIMLHMHERVQHSPQAQAAVQEVRQHTLSIMKQMISWDQVRSSIYKSMQIEPVIPTSRSANLARSKSVQENRHSHRELAELSITQLITQLVQCDQYAREHVLATSNEWKSGRLHRAEPEHYKDITDGLVFRQHSELSRAATPEEHNDVRVALYLYNDDFTSVNAIGTKRGAHKYSVHMAAIANLPLRSRFRAEYILPFLIAQSNLVEDAGLHLILCGVHAAGAIVDDTNNFAAEMRDLANGVQISIPDDEGGGMR